MMKFKIYIIIALIFLIPNICLSNDNISQLNEFNWDNSKDDVLSDKNIKLLRNDDNQVLLLKNIYGRNSVVGYVFDNGKLITINYTFGKFNNTDEADKFSNKIIDQLNKNYNKVESLDNLYDNYRSSLNKNLYDNLIKLVGNEKWQNLYKSNDTNILYRIDKSKENGIITLRYEKNDWLNKNNKSEMDNNWEFRKEESKLDKKINLYVRKKSNNTLTNSIGRQEHGYLLFRCMDNKTDLFVEFPEFIGINGANVRYKIDDNSIKKENWDTSNDGTNVFSPKPISLLNNLKNGKNFIIKLDTYRNLGQELEFNIDGIDEYIDMISESCKWKNKK